MRNPNRISDTLVKLAEVWVKYPDLRLGQLLLNVTKDPELYYIEDDALIKKLEAFYGGLK